ncbi:MAG: hypothetical protein AAGI49_00725 [Bacteroidota bacterium]
MNIEKSKVFYLVKKLPKSEIKKFRSFLASPFFNRREDVSLLFDELVRHIGKPIEPKQVFKKLYGTRRFSERDLSLVMSYLFKLLEHYFTYKAVFTKTRQLQNDIQLIEQYQQLQAPKLYQEKLKQIEKKQREQSIQNASYFTLQYQLLEKQFEFSSIERPSETEHLKAISTALDISFIAQKLRLLCFTIAHRSVYKANFQPQLIDAIMAYVKTARLEKIPAIGIYFYIYQMFTTEQPNPYFQFVKTALFQHQNALPQKELRDIYMMTINYLIRFINERKMNYLQETLELYKAGLEQDILLENNTITRFTFNNIVRIALRCNELEWVSSFVEIYHTKLGKRYQKSFYAFGRAAIAFQQKEYEQVLAHLQQFYSRDILLNLGTKTLRSKTYYELGEFELLSAHLEAMYNYIQRNKVLGYHRDNYLKIISYINKLLQVNIYSREALHGLKEALAQENTLSEKDWLLLKLEHLNP